MPTIVTHSIIQDGSGDYTTVQGWETGEQRNLVSADEIEHGIIQGTWPSAETGELIVDGWSSDATRYIILEATGSSRHNGTFETGSAWAIEFTGAPSTFGVVFVEDNHWVDLIGLQVSLKDNPNGSKAPYATGTGNSFGLRLRMDSCIARQDGNEADANYSGLFLEGTVQLRNCLCFHINPTGFWARGWGWVSAVEGAEQNLAYNCTAIGFKGDSSLASGFYINTQTDDVLIINCIASGTEGRAFLDNPGSGIASGSDFNAADKAIDAGARGVNSRESQSFTFVDALNNDFHLASGDTGAKGFGRDPSGMPVQSFTDDIDGDTRSAPFDIGMDEFTEVAPPPLTGSLLFPNGRSAAVPTDGLLYPRYRVLVG